MPRTKQELTAYMRRYYADGKAAGLCYHCRAPLAEDSASYCEEHLAKSRETAKARYWRYRAEGRCVKCGRPSDGKTMCEAHGHWMVRKFRPMILERDGHRCHWCGGKADTVDRIVTALEGGRYTPDNCVAACRSCNSSRSRHHPKPPILAERN